MSGNRVLMIKDGMRMNEGYGANGLNDIVGRGFIDPDTLKQVEVAKGDSSSLYGSDALAGTIVFTTKDPEDYLKNGGNIAGRIKHSQSEFPARTWPHRNRERELSLLTNPQPSLVLSFSRQVSRMWLL